MRETEVSIGDKKFFNESDQAKNPVSGHIEALVKGGLKNFRNGKGETKT